jgi:hypothetical protein
MKQQPVTPDRMLTSQGFAHLSMVHDLYPDEVFQRSFAQCLAEFRSCALLHGHDSADIRHVCRADGRQRFILFLDGEIFDHFDFSATVVGGPGVPDDGSGDFEDDPAFMPFDA